MRNLKKILALALALVMVLSMMTVANAFTDSEKVEASYTEAVDVLAGMGVFEGYEDGSFKPQGDITRAEVAAIVYRLATGDVEDKNVAIHADHAQFADVPASHWAAGYIGYCANAEYVKGYGDGNFGPSDKVTGYAALAMILRAVGYDVNGEFTGEGWEVKVAAVATDLGLLKNITKGSLGVPATRELVAEVLFQTANKAYMVSWTNAFGYQPVKYNASGDAYTGIWGYTYVGAEGYTLTLGLKNFGLAYDYAYVSGNAGTHEKATVLTNWDEYSEEYTSVAFDFASGRELFGHEVKVWHNIFNPGQTYAWYDQAVSHEVVAGYGLTLEGVVEGLVKAGRVTTQNGYSVSEAYGHIGAGEDTESGIYVVVDNGKNEIVIVATDVTVDAIVAKNNYLKDKTVRFVGEEILYQAQVENLAKFAVGETVIMEEIVGTTAASPKFYSTFVLDAVSYTTGVITDIDTDTYELTLKGGKKVEISPLCGLDMEEVELFGGVTYNFMLDAKGCYIDLWETGAEYAELIATWAWYKTTGDSEDEYSYKVMGVDAQGKKVTYDIDLATYAALVDEYGVKAKLNVGAETDLINDGCAAVTLVNTGKVWVLADETPAGISEIDDELVLVAGDNVVGADDNYLIDESTSFFFVSGNSTSNLKVVEYKGTTELVGKGGAYALDTEAVSLFSTTELRTNIVIGENYHVDTIVVVDKYITVELGSMIYVEAGTKAGSVLNKETETRKLPVYIDGEKSSIPVLDEMIGEYTELDEGAFYTYIIVEGVYFLAPVEGLIDAEVLTAGTIGASVSLKANGEIYKVTKDTKIVTLGAAKKILGENVNTYGEFVELAMQLTEVGTIEGISIDAAPGLNGVVTTLYIVGVTDVQESAPQA